MTAHKLNYIQSFDTLRGLAVLFVLLLHGSYGFCIGGWIGVDLFFVLSGFLITTLLQNEFENTSTISFKSFYLRRVLRLLPALATGIIFANVLWIYTNLPEGNRGLATLGSFFYFMNLLPNSICGNLAHLWSLSVEEHFYFFWPVLTLLVIFKLGYRQKIVVIAMLIFLSMLFRLFLFQTKDGLHFGIINLTAERFTFCRMDGILLGAMFAILQVTRINNVTITKASQYKGTLLLLLCLLTFGVILLKLDQQSKFFTNGGFVLTNLLCLLTVVLAFAYQNNFLFKNKILKWIGMRSYGIYVYHFPIFLILENYRIAGNSKNLLLITFLRFALSIAVAAISYALIEKPLLKLKRRFEEKESKLNLQNA